MRRLYFILTFICIVLFAGCKHVRVFNEYQTTNNLWSMYDTLNYNVEMNDTTTPYEMILNIRYNNNYKYRNLYLFVHTTMPDSTILADTLSLFLSTPDGQLLGKGMGKTKEAQFILSNNVFFKEPGVYNFSIIHGMRNDTIEGIEKVGITLNKFIE